MTRIPLLPHWVITDKYPAFYDVESATTVEQTSKLYGKMQELIEDYNKYVDEINKTITEFIEGTNSDQEEFKNQITKIMHDYIAMIDEKIKQQDQVIEDSITYIKENIIEGLQVMIKQMIELGELDEAIADSFNNLDTRVAELEKTKIVKNIAEMKGLQNLNAGDIIKTIGYYSANDEGGATYLIREKLETDIEDLGAIHIINDTLVAELIIENEVIFEQFGAKGNAIDDDTIFINNAIQYAKKHNKTIKVNSMYAISEPLTININKFTMYGENRGCGFIQLNNNKDVLIIDRPYQNDFTGFDVKNLKLMWKDKAGENTAGIRFAQLSENKDGWGLHNSKFENIFIEYPCEGIFIDDNEPIWNIDFINIHIYGASRRGVYYGNGFGCKFDVTIIGDSNNSNIARTHAFVCGGGATCKLDIEDWNCTLFKADKSFNPVHITEFHIERCSISNDYGKFIEISNTPCLIDSIMMFNSTVGSANHCGVISIYGTNGGGANMVDIRHITVHSLVKINTNAKLSAILPIGEGTNIANLISQRGCDYAFYPYAPENTKANCFYKHANAY